MSNPKPKILLLGAIEHAHTQWASLSTLAELITPPPDTDRTAFIQQCRSGAYSGVLAAYRTFDSLSITGRFDAELCAALPDSWRYLCHCGAGYDQIDVNACSARDPPLLVSNTPTAVDDATADTAMFLILGTLRNFNGSMAALRRNQWRGEPPVGFGHDPQGKVLGILGMGGIGGNLAEKARAFGMTVIYHNRSRLEDEEMEGGARYVGFEELLRTSDVLSLNLPLNAKTRHTISKTELTMMKRSAILINTARGAIVDEDALVDALDNDVIAGAGLDVYEDEPRVHPGLVRNETKVMLLPHMGTWSYETEKKMEEWVIDNIRGVLEGKGLKSMVPEQKRAGLG